MTPKYQGFLNGRKRRWTLQLCKAGASLVSDDHDIGLNTFLQYGQNNIFKMLDLLVMPASLQFTISDPEAIIWNDMRNSGQFDFTLKINDDQQEYGIDLFVKLADSAAPLKDQYAIPATRLLAFCGITRLAKIGVDTATSTRTVHQVFKELLNDTIRDQDIMYTFGWRNERTSATQPWIESLRFEDLVYD